MSEPIDSTNADCDQCVRGEWRCECTCYLELRPVKCTAFEARSDGSRAPYPFATGPWVDGEPPKDGTLILGYWKFNGEIAAVRWRQTTILDVVLFPGFSWYFTEGTHRDKDPDKWAVINPPEVSE